MVVDEGSRGFIERFVGRVLEGREKYRCELNVESGKQKMGKS